MSRSTQSEIEERSLADLVPYWRNPRRISDEAVNAVASSIEKYGYRQPIVVDANDVIIIGHTRYLALRRLGYEKIHVRVEKDLTPRQVKQLRAIDNRSAEYTTWDYDKLVEELHSLDDDLAGQMFPEVAQNQGETHTEFVQAELADARQAKPDDPDLAEFMCPSCFHAWEQKVTEKAVRAGRIKAKG